MNDKKPYPLSVSVTMVVIAVILSFVDLTFLNDVIGKVLDFGTIESILVAFALGLVGLVIMAHQGIKAAHGDENKYAAAGHYILWIMLGLAFVLIRLFSATILHLDAASGDQSLVSILGMNVREIDLVLAPLMFFLYVATGLMMKDGAKNLLLNPEFEKNLAAWKAARRQKRDKESQLRDKAEQQQEKLRLEAEERLKKRAMEVENGRLKSAANGSYGNALAQFRAKEKEIKQKYQKISENISFIRTIDKQEREFEQKVKPSLMHIVDTSVHSAQNSVALMVRKQNQEESIDSLRAVIEAHNISGRK